jgi:DNA modification methylase
VIWISAELLSVSTGKISEWTTDLQQEKSEEEKVRIIELWLACETQENIANNLDINQTKVSRIIQKLQTHKTEEMSENPPDSLKIFNLWNFGKSSDALKYPGQIPSQIVENLLWYYTKPFDVVYDPMAGGGTTICIVKQHENWREL